MRQNKYGNRKTIYNGVKFDSKKEAEYCMLLDQLKMAVDPKERVEKYELQPSFLLQEAFEDRNGVRHRKIEYRADFHVFYSSGREEIVDVKGMKTETYKIKKKLLLYKYPNINFKEV